MYHNSNTNTGSAKAHTSTPVKPVQDRLWKILSNRKTYGLLFRKDQFIGPYRVDYCCHAEKIVVEISDFPFENAAQIDLTMERHLYLIDRGYTVLGFDINTISHNPGYIREMIKSHVQMNHAGEMENFNFDFGF